MSGVPREWRILPPHVFVASAAAEWLLHRYLPVAHWIPESPQRLGWIVAGAGLAIGVVGAGLFRRRGTTVRPTREPAVLVTEGLYRFSRNPMYMGMVLILIGEAIVLGSVSPWFVLPVHVAYFRLRFIRWEEAALLAHFGDEYARYRSRVRRWI